MGRYLVSEKPIAKGRRSTRRYGTRKVEYWEVHFKKVERGEEKTESSAQATGRENEVLQVAKGGRR